jgi:hypothetical protein
MAIQAMALGVDKPAINALGAFHEGAQARQTFDSNQITLARQGLETIGAIALGSMDRPILLCSKKGWTIWLRTG